MGDMGLDVSPSLDVISLENCESMVDPMLLEYTYNTYTYIYISKLIISPRLCMYVYIYIHTFRTVHIQ
jgi:hypothetical protein